MTKILLKNTNALIRGTNSYEAVPNVDILIKDEYIELIKKTGTLDLKLTEDAEVIDMHNKLIMPGLVNSHTHSAMTLLRGIGSALPLQEWLSKIWPIEDLLGKDELITGTELAILEMLSTGTVSFSDMYMMPNETSKCMESSGIKANITRPITGGYDVDNLNDYKNFINRIEAINLYENLNSMSNGRILVDFSIHGEYTTNHKLISYFIDEIKDYPNSRLHIHLSETEREQKECIQRTGKTPASLFNSLGAFKLNTFCAHCVHLTDEDIDLLSESASTGNNTISIVHNPSSNLKLGSGIAPLRKFLDKKINTALGTDGASSNNNLNMFEEMHLASIIHSGYTRDPSIINPTNVIDMATINGAKLQGRKNTGLLKEGYKADLIAINLDKPHLSPYIYPESLIVYSAQGSDVCMTMVDGKILYKDGEFLTLDKDKIFHKANKIAEKIIS